MKATTKLTLQGLLGCGISGLLLLPIAWNYGPTADDPPELKIGAIIFCELMAFYYGMTHRTPDKTKLLDQVRIEKWLSGK
jgi:hypothetical protein